MGSPARWTNLTGALKPRESLNGYARVASDLRLRRGWSVWRLVPCGDDRVPLHRSSRNPCFVVLVLDQRAAGSGATNWTPMASATRAISKRNWSSRPRLSTQGVCFAHAPHSTPSAPVRSLASERSASNHGEDLRGKQRGRKPLAHQRKHLRSRQTIPVFPLLRHGRIKCGPTARMADRAVLIELT